MREISLSVAKNSQQEIKLSKRPYVSVTIRGTESLVQNVKGFLDTVLDWAICDNVDLGKYLALGVCLDNSKITTSEFTIIEKQKKVSE